MTKKSIPLERHEAQLVARLRRLQKESERGIMRVCWSPGGIALYHRQCFEVVLKTEQVPSESEKESD